jgi:hypothetical protein
VICIAGSRVYCYSAAITLTFLLQLYRPGMQIDPETQSVDYEQISLQQLASHAEEMRDCIHRSWSQVQD